MMQSELSEQLRGLTDIVELRRYTLYPRQRDVLIDLFDKRFVESQEAVGMKVIGQFRNLDDPDQFVWLRGYTDMLSRKHGLESFYGGPVWARHCEAANATMSDFSNVLLLRRVQGEMGFSFADCDRSFEIAGADPRVLVMHIHYADRTIGDAHLRFLQNTILPALAENGAEVLAGFVSEYSPNDFERLPIRTAHAIAWICAFADVAAYEAYKRLRVQSAGSESRLIEDWLETHFRVGREELWLQPTSRSQMR